MYISSTSNLEVPFPIFLFKEISKFSILFEIIFISKETSAMKKPTTESQIKQIDHKDYVVYVVENK